ncbi:site-specific DNA-methyltransferase [Phocaeicola plebeius]|jgi:adenine-specific DNA-methyltransferase|uniref:site-specific DNA-methyltransferase n=1 Tax=Phocaeicola plebeius TaxID=310297 RepID=UPI00241C903A|nr:site-specific DNA-methyltransferase [Phocaeicola plebeius]
MKPNKLELSSVDRTQLNLEALYQIAPSCFTEVKDDRTGELRHVVNFKTLRQLLGDNAVEDADEMYQFTWPGKQEARREAARPTTKTLRPVVEDSVDWDNTQNLYIEGDNLEVLKLLQKSYMGKVKMIYIDPPYNTGNDFVYDDDFAASQDDYDLFAGNIDELGNRYRKNTETNGRFHSDWCSMMYSRLMVARSLLTEDGVIFISIDDNEQRNLKNICDEIFGDKNFLGNITIIVKPEGRRYGSFAKCHESCLVYAKDKDLVECNEIEVEGATYQYFDEIGGFNLKGLRNRNVKAFNSTNRPNLRYPFYVDINHPDQNNLFPVTTIANNNYVKVEASIIDGLESVWRWGKETSEQKKSQLTAYKGPDGIIRIFQKERKLTQTAKTVWIDKRFISNKGTKESIDLLGKGIFDYPKPLKLVEQILQIGSEEESIILDFFSGSSTTAHAVMQLNAEDCGNRKYIMVQLPEETPEDSEARKAGYDTIPEIAKERIRRAGKKIKEESPLTTQKLDTGFRVFRLADSNFEEVKKAPAEYDQSQLDLFLNNVKSDRTDLDLLFGAILSWGVQLSLPMTSEEVDGKMIYSVNDGDLVACFADDITENIVKAMADKQPLRVLFRDSCFARDDAKINVFETLKQLLDWSEEEAIKNIKVI